MLLEPYVRIPSFSEVRGRLMSNRKQKVMTHKKSIRFTVFKNMLV